LTIAIPSLGIIIAMYAGRELAEQFLMPENTHQKVFGPQWNKYI
jgi:hypothetical protein